MVTATRRQDHVEVPQTGLAARLAIRARAHTGGTSGLAPGFVQGNLAILPAALAGDFLRFCQLNPKPCPLLASSAPGDWRLPSLADDLDIRTDVPRYRVWRDGALVDEPIDLKRCVARRSRDFRARLLVFVRGGADRERHRDPPHHPQLHRADVSHHDRDRGRRAVPRAAGRLDAADEAEGRDPRRADHDALSGGARRAGPSSASRR